MKFMKKLMVGILVCGLSMASAFGQQKWPDKIVFGVIPTAGTTSIEEMWGPIVKYLQKQLGIKVELKFADDYTAVITGMQHNHIDVAYFGPKSYVEAAKRANAEAIALEVDAESGLPGYYGIIITKKGSGLNTLESIKGKTWAFTDPQSTSGTLVPTVMFFKKGITPNKYFSRVIYSGGHEASILSVKAGKVDAASTNNLDFNRGLGRSWKSSDFNIIWKSSLIPGAPVAVRKDLPSSLKLALQGAFLSYDDPEGLKKLKDKGFVRGKDSNFDPVRELIEVKNKLKK